jgi:hypothetical protein
VLSAGSNGGDGQIIKGRNDRLNLCAVTFCSRSQGVLCSSQAPSIIFYVRTHAVDVLTSSDLVLASILV